MQPIKDAQSRALRDLMSELLAKIQDQQFYFGPAISIFQFNQIAEAVEKLGLTVRGKRCIDFGCGGPRPYAISTLLYLAGAHSVTAIDEDRPFENSSAALCILSLIHLVLADQHAVRFDLFKTNNDLARLRALDFHQPTLLSGRVEAAVPASITLRHCLYQDMSEEERKFDLLVANSVFEHVSDIQSVLSQLRASISTGGAIFAAVDYRDHRAYTPGSNASAWEYLFDDGDYNPGYINRIRHSEMLKLAEQAGFQVVFCRPVLAHMTDTDRERILPQFRSISSEDLAVLSANIVLVPQI